MTAVPQSPAIHPAADPELHSLDLDPLTSQEHDQASAMASFPRYAIAAAMHFLSLGMPADWHGLEELPEVAGAMAALEAS